MDNNLIAGAVLSCFFAKIADKAFEKDLYSAQKHEINNWIKGIPANVRPNINAAIGQFLDEVINPLDLAPGSSIALVINKIEKYIIPDEEEWIDAFFERLESVQARVASLADLQSFFALSKSEIFPYFRTLAQSFKKTYEINEKFVTQATYGISKRIEENVSQLNVKSQEIQVNAQESHLFQKEQFEEIKMLILENNNFNKHNDISAEISEATSYITNH